MVIRDSRFMLGDEIETLSITSCVELLFVRTEWLLLQMDVGEKKEVNTTLQVFSFNIIQFFKMMRAMLIIKSV